MTKAEEVSERVIRVSGAREHNLKNIDVSIPKEKLVVFSGLSGSGKSSLAFDTLYAEGRRRYTESLSSYARQFLGLSEKPDVDRIDGLSPAVSIDQRTVSKNPRSTVGTVTEIYDYIRLLYAKIGIPHCPVCGREIKGQSTDEIVKAILLLPEGTRLKLAAPVVRGRKGEQVKLLNDAVRAGFLRARIDGSEYLLSDEIKLEKNQRHNIDIIVDRLVIKEGIKTRLTDSAETALSLSDGLLSVILEDGEELEFFRDYACPEHRLSLPELTPRIFSFNSPFGACPECGGLGEYMSVEHKLLIPDPSLSIREGAINCFGWSKAEGGSTAEMYFEGLARHYGFSIDVPLSEMKKEDLDRILYGSGEEKIEFSRITAYSRGSFRARFEGVVNNLERKYRETGSEIAKRSIEKVMSLRKCPKCKGRRLRDESLCVTVGGLSIDALCELPVKEELKFFEELKINERELAVAAPILRETASRLSFLNDVGLGYLSLSRRASTLSGGESRRIRLATQIGSALTGVLYILDEPSIGLHQRDGRRLIETLKGLRDFGNTLIAVEHDEEIIRAADYIVDIGPGAGRKGGEVVAFGSVKDIESCEASLTGQYLSGKKKIAVPERRRKTDKGFLELKGACENNLKNIDVKIPLGVITCVTGVSGSGKSTLVNGIIYRELAHRLNRAKTFPGYFRELTGFEALSKVINIDQSPIGRMPTSNPATYTELFGDIRELFALTPDARRRGYGASRFSFNVKGGRCEACRGAGTVKIEMHFLADIYVPCELCGGSRYNSETLEVRYKGKNIAQVLQLTVDEALEFFTAVPKIRSRLQTLKDVGLGYMRLGQSALSLSGGEAQRVKLATELSKRSKGRTLYILDEPTTGLHTDDVRRLIEILDRLADAGNTVLVIEHNPEVIKTADYIIDLGPEGGDEGGRITAFGTPEEVASCKDSYTGEFLRKLLK